MSGIFGSTTDARLNSEMDSLMSQSANALGQFQDLMWSWLPNYQGMQTYRYYDTISESWKYKQLPYGAKPPVYKDPETGKMVEWENTTGSTNLEENPYYNPENAALDEYHRNLMMQGDAPQVAGLNDWDESAAGLMSKLQDIPQQEQEAMSVSRMLEQYASQVPSLYTRPSPPPPPPPFDDRTLPPRDPRRNVAGSVPELGEGNVSTGDVVEGWDTWGSGDTKGLGDNDVVEGWDTWGSGDTDDWRTKGGDSGTRRPKDSNQMGGEPVYENWKNYINDPGILAAYDLFKDSGEEMVKTAAEQGGYGRSADETGAIGKAWLGSLLPQITEAKGYQERAIQRGTDALQAHINTTMESGGRSRAGLRDQLAATTSRADLERAIEQQRHDAELASRDAMRSRMESSLYSPGGMLPSTIGSSTSKGT